MQQYPTVCVSIMSSSSITHVEGGSACWIRAEPILLQWHGGHSDILCGVLQRLCHGVMGCPLGMCCRQILSSWAMVWSPRHAHMAGWTDSWISNWNCGMENSPGMCCKFYSGRETPMEPWLMLCYTDNNCMCANPKRTLQSSWVFGNMLMDFTYCKELTNKNCPIPPPKKEGKCYCPSSVPSL